MTIIKKTKNMNELLKNLLLNYPPYIMIMVKLSQYRSSYVEPSELIEFDKLGFNYKPLSKPISTVANLVI